jgi:hypothetical protein
LPPFRLASIQNPLRVLHPLFRRFAKRIIKAPCGQRKACCAGMTFRKLPDKDKAGINEKKAIALMLAQPSMIKRPVLDLGGGKLVVGFKPEVYSEKTTARG